jgi:Holliday junction resolvasome RuvABC endonuclease subunit
MVIMILHQKKYKKNKMINKQLQKPNLDELFSERKILQLQKQTLLNILSAKGIIYTYYKNNKLTKRNYAQRKSKYNS